MKTCKRLVSLLLALCFALGCAAYASTEITQESTEQTAQTTVVLDLGVEPTHYTIVIPSTVNLDAEGKGSATITLKSGFVLTDVTSLKVRMTGGYSGYNSYYVSSGAGGYTQTSYPSMQLKNTENDSSVTCKITSQNEGRTFTKETSLIHVTNKTDNSSDISDFLSFAVDGTLPSYGKYTGTLTFTVVTE